MLTFYHEQVQSSLPTGDLAVQVLTDSVIPTGMSVLNIPGNTLTGARGALATLGVGVTFSGGGGTIPSIFSGGWPDYPPSAFIPSLFTFASSAPTQVSASRGGGQVELVDNSAQPLTITVSVNRTVCVAAALVRTIPVSGNIGLLDEGDIDIGGVVGPPIGPFTTPRTDNIPVRMRCASSILKAFAVTVVFNKFNINVADCTVGSAWQGNFACTISNTLGIVEIYGVNANSELSGSNLELAKLSLTSVSNGLSRIHGFRSQLATSRYADHPCVAGGGPPTNCSFIAGDTPVMVLGGGGTRRIEERTEEENAPLAMISPWIPSYRSRNLLSRMHTLQPSGGLKYGDINNDGTFDLTDVLFAQEFFNRANSLGCPITGGRGCQVKTAPLCQLGCVRVFNFCRV